MFECIKEAYRRVISFAILRIARKQLLRNNGVVCQIQTRMTQSPSPSDVLLLRHQLNTAVKYTVDIVACRCGNITPETRKRLVDKLFTECLRLCGLPDESIAEKPIPMVREAPVHSRSPRQGPPFTSRPDPIIRPAARHSPQDQVSRTTASPRNNILPSPADNRRHNLSERSASQPHRHQSASTNRVPTERYETSTSAYHDHRLDARQIKPTRHSPPPDWIRPLPGEEPTDVIMAETDGVRADLKGNDDSHRQQPAAYVVYAVQYRLVYEV